MKPDILACLKCSWRTHTENWRAIHNNLEKPCNGAVVPMYSLDSFVSKIEERIKIQKNDMTSTSLMEQEAEYMQGGLDELESLKSELMEGE